ncbi:MAG: glycerate kinase [Lachnospiraceae bacterium]|nr:glycerate kinase [Lachnospiraceae bacterium]
MKVAVAIDSFKGSMSSTEAGEAAKDGILRVWDDADVTVCPLADGGEGTVDALTRGMRGEFCKVKVFDPLGRRITAEYGIVDPGRTAVIEMSAAAGLTLIGMEERDPALTTTYGVGEIIKDALAKGCRNFIIGIGGSATNDGGIGMLQALGFGMLDERGKSVPYGAKGAGCLCSIKSEEAAVELKDSVFRIACDVKNPLCGENGASLIYGPQKGADPEKASQMDAWLGHYAAMVKRYHPEADPDYPGSGAAGGMGFAFRTFLGGTLEPGIDIVIEETGIEEIIKAADIVITGEGRIDRQTAMGKAPVGIARIAKKYNKPVIALAGGLGEGAEECIAKGVDAIFPIVRQPVSLEEAMEPKNAIKNLSDTAEQLFRALKTGCEM